MSDRVKKKILKRTERQNERQRDREIGQLKAQRDGLVWIERNI